MLCALATLMLPIGALAQGGGEVQTFAGTGEAGIADGPMATATFLLPVAIAVAKDGTIYVADQAAQRIRAISGGIVRTVAGAGDVSPSGIDVDAGYRDGPALRAWFSHPSGLAIGPDGALYIADSENHCIRKLDKGTVSTVVGDPREPKALDGDATTGRFLDPRALAFDADGNLYIADFGGGLRRFSRAGKLTTIKLADARVFGVTVVPNGGGIDIVVTTPESVTVHHPSGPDESYPFSGFVEGHRPFGRPHQLAALSPREFIFSDVQSGDIGYLRLPQKPSVTTVYARTIAGGQFERFADNAGYADGTREQARFYDPMGIVVQNGSVLLADAGNRRIRRIALPHVRMPESSSGTSRPFDAQHYEVAYVGGSSVFYDSLGDDSICAHLERALDRSGRVPRPARCHPVRVDGFSLEALHRQIVTYAAKANLVVLQVGPDEMVHTNLAAFKAAINDIESRLKSTRGRLAVVWSYTAPQVAGSEFFDGREINPAFREVPLKANIQRKSQIDTMQAMLRSSNVPQVDLYDEIIAHVRSAGGTPLFANVAEDIYPHAGSNGYFAGAIAKFLLAPATKVL